jgi:hypothetical protein
MVRYCILFRYTVYDNHSFHHHPVLLVTSKPCLCPLHAIGWYRRLKMHMRFVCAFDLHLLLRVIVPKHDSAVRYKKTRSEICPRLILSNKSLGGICEFESSSSGVLEIFVGEWELPQRSTVFSSQRFEMFGKTANSPQLSFWQI